MNEHRGHAAAAICLTAGVAGVAVVVFPSAGLLLLGVVAALLAAQLLGTGTLLIVVVGTTFASRLEVGIGNGSLLVEHVAVLILLLAVVLEGRFLDLVRAATSRTAVLIAAFVVWQAIISIARAPEPAESLQLVSWLVLDWLILVAVVAGAGDSVFLERWGVRFAGIASAIAIGLWLAVTFGLSTFGAQVGEYGNDLQAAYGLSYEANILASTLAVWIFIAISSGDAVVRRMSRAVVPLAVLALLLTFTRAAILALVGGLAIWMLLSGRAAVAGVLRLTLAGLVIVAVSVFAVPSLADSLANRATELTDITQGTGQYRVAASETALNDLTTSGVAVGLGTNSFGQRHTDPTIPGQPWYLSNLPLQFIYDGGIIGVLLIFAAVVSLRPHARTNSGRAVGALVVYLIASLATSPFWFGSTWLIVALAVMSRPSISEAALVRHPREAPYLRTVG